MQPKALIPAAALALALTACNGGGSTPAPIGTVGGPTPIPSGVPTVGPTLAPGASPTPLPSGVPTLAPTATPSGLPTNAPTVAPTTVPTAAPGGTPVPFPTFTPFPSPSPNQSQYVLFTSGTSSSWSYGSFDAGTVTEQWPIMNTGQPVNVSLTGYNGFPTSLPAIAGARNVVALAYQNDFGGTPVPFIGGNQTWTWNAHAGTPTGTWHIATYTPATQAGSGWTTGLGTSTISGSQVTITIPVSAGVGILGNTQIYYAIYQ